MKKKRSPSRYSYEEHNYSPHHHQQQQQEQLSNDPILKIKGAQGKSNRQQLLLQQEDAGNNGDVVEPDDSSSSSSSNSTTTSSNSSSKDDTNGGRARTDGPGLQREGFYSKKYVSDTHILNEEVEEGREIADSSSSSSSSSSPTLTAPLSKLIKTSRTSLSTTQASLISISNDPHLPAICEDALPPYSSSASSCFSSASSTPTHTSTSTSTCTSPSQTGGKRNDYTGENYSNSNVHANQSGHTRNSNNLRRYETSGKAEIVSLTRSKLSSILSSSVPSVLGTSRPIESGSMNSSSIASSLSTSSVSKSLPASTNNYYSGVSRSRDPGSGSGSGSMGRRGLFLKRYPNDPSSKEGVDIDEMISSLIDTVGDSKNKTKDSSSFSSTAFSLGSRRSHRGNSTFPYRSWQIQLICSVAREIFMTQPTLLRLQAPIKVAGDIHGQFADLLRIFKLSGFPDQTNYLFLGDYVDRGRQSLETILLLLCYKIKYPNNFFMLRGNHESANVTRMYGFYDECKRRKNTKVWKSFIDVFNCLPFAAVINNKIFCVHGGISPDLKSVRQIANDVHRPTDIPDEGLITDLLWSDPHPGISDWSLNDRGVSYTFSKKNVLDFCTEFKFDLIVRGHMVVEDGYEFFARKKLVTVFSAPNYCGVFENWGAVLSINSGLMCSFELLKPHQLKKSGSGG